ncbi:MAG: hypothetical protein RLY61_720, partial [Candidatus Parcubacteria bacterium]
MALLEVEKEQLQKDLAILYTKLGLANKKERQHQIQLEMNTPNVWEDWENA